MYSFDFHYKRTKIKNEKKKRIINHIASYDQWNTKIAIENFFSIYLTCIQLDYMKKMKKNDKLKIYRMWDAEASRSRTRQLLENKKQNMFASKNNLESTSLNPQGSLNLQGERVQNPPENRKTKV